MRLGIGNNNFNTFSNNYRNIWIGINIFIRERKIILTIFYTFFTFLTNFFNFYLV